MTWRKAGIIIQVYPEKKSSEEDTTIYAMAYKSLLFLLTKAIAGKACRKDSQFEAWESSSNGLPGNLSVNNLALYKDILVASGDERGLPQGMTTDK